MNAIRRNRLALGILLALAVIAAIAYEFNMVGISQLNQIASKQNAIYGIGEAAAFNKSAMISGSYPGGNGYWVNNFYSLGFFPIGNTAGPVLVQAPQRFANSSMPYQVGIRVEYSNTTHAESAYNAALLNSTYEVPNVGIGNLAVKNISLGAQGFRGVTASFAYGRYFIVVSTVGSSAHLNQSYASGLALRIYSQLGG